MKDKTITKAFAAARRMPPLCNSIPGQEFDIMDSEVAKWLVEQPGIRQYIFTKTGSSNSGLGLIVYDKTTGTWRGVDYDDGDDV